MSSPDRHAEFPPVHRERFHVRAGEIGPGGSLRLPSLADYLQEVAGNHALALDYATDQLLARGLTWVLSRLRLDVRRLPAWRDEVTIETWPSGVHRLFALREFRVLDAAGQALAVATSAWLILKVASKRPIRPPAELADFAKLTPPRVLEETFEELPPAEAGDGTPFRVTRYDLDLNGHANNVAILRWILEALPGFPAPPLTLESEFRAECFEGDHLAARLQPEGPGTFRHALIRPSDDREVARARTRASFA